jgi:hypothetical protein
MCKWKWAVVVSGYTGHDGSDYGVGMGSADPHEHLVAMCYTHAAAARELDRLERVVAKALPPLWGQPLGDGRGINRPDYEVVEYAYDLGWSERDADQMDADELHNRNLRNAKIRKIRE